MVTAAPQLKPVSAPQPLLRSHMPELDTIRGIAVLMVLFFHGFGFHYGLGGLSGITKLFVSATLTGWTGVYLFFALSGFLITGILLDSKPRPDFYRRFYFRRAVRILPLYYAVLLLIIVTQYTGLVGRHVSWAFLGLSAIYLSNVTQLLGVPLQYGTLWSLAVEEHFYLLWPTVVRRLSPRRIAIVAVLICVICPVLRAISFLNGHAIGTGYTWFVADALAAGSLLALFCRSRWFTRRTLWRATTAVFIICIAVALIGRPFGILSYARFLGLTFKLTLINFTFVAVVALSLLLATGRCKALVHVPLLQFFGNISYGIYLLQKLSLDIADHFLAREFPSLVAQPGQGHFSLMVLRFCIGGGLAIGLATLSRRYFEEPFLRLKKHTEPSTTRHARAASGPATTDASTVVIPSGEPVISLHATGACKPMFAVLGCCVITVVCNGCPNAHQVLVTLLGREVRPRIIFGGLARGYRMCVSPAGIWAISPGPPNPTCCESSGNTSDPAMSFTTLAQTWVMYPCLSLNVWARRGEWLPSNLCRRTSRSCGGISTSIS